MASSCHGMNIRQGNVLAGKRKHPVQDEFQESGTVIARVIIDGPDADFENLRWTLLAAWAEEQTSMQILTPYFLADQALIMALNLAALRGMHVDILLPEKNSLLYLHWASRAMWWQVLDSDPRLQVIL